MTEFFRLFSLLFEDILSIKSISQVGISAYHVGSERIRLGGSALLKWVCWLVKLEIKLFLSFFLKLILKTETSVLCFAHKLVITNICF